MHEISIAEDLQKIILKISCQNDLKKITKVNLQFGEMAQIVPDIFRIAFEESSKHTIFEGAMLDMEILPVKLKCEVCHHEFFIKKSGSYSCSNCHSNNIEIIQGKEILIKSIEGE